MHMHGGSPHANELPQIDVSMAHEQPSEHRLRAAKTLDLKLLTMDHWLGYVDATQRDL